jgi:hypothetical protein
MWLPGFTVRERFFDLFVGEDKLMHAFQMVILDGYLAAAASVYLIGGALTARELSSKKKPLWIAPLSFVVVAALALAWPAGVFALGARWSVRRLANFANARNQSAHPA